MNHKRKKIKNKQFITIAIIAIVIISVVSYILMSNKKLNVIESFFKDCFITIERVVYKPIGNFSNMINDFNNLKDVQKENKILKSNIEKIESLEAENNELKDELKKIKEELNIEHVLTDYTYLNATVVSRNNLFWYNNLTIDKGTKSGIKEGMVVINSTGLIGKVENVSTFTSNVKLITTNDTNNKISVSISNGSNKITGLINGYDYNNGLLNVEGISNTETVSVGDMVYTSGLGGVFPSGILIGKVENITTDVYDLAKIIKVKPSAHFNDINYVTILKRNDIKWWF